MLRTILLSLLLTGLAGQVAANSDQWAWFVARSAIDQWGTEVGKTATVRISGNNVSIELTDKDGWRHRLRGSKSGDTISVKLSTNETDLENYPLIGRYTRKIWTKPLQESLGRENIELVGSGIVVGLTRDIKQSSVGAKK